MPMAVGIMTPRSCHLSSLLYGMIGVTLMHAQVQRPLPLFVLYA